ncbi:MAG: hypothetical protein AABX11_01475 [Nanoarchaeota archaeon]
MDNLEVITENQTNQRKINWPATIICAPFLATYAIGGAYLMAKYAVDRQMDINESLGAITMFGYIGGYFAVHTALQKCADFIQRFSK